MQGRDREVANAAVVRRAVDRIWNCGELDLADHLFSVDYVNHGGLISDLVHGPEAVKVSVALLRAAFPTLHVTIEALTAEGDAVNVRWAADGNSVAHTGRESGVDARERLTGTTRSSLAGGQIVESWTDWDHAKALGRLPMIPPAARA